MAEQVVNIPLEKLHPFPNHPFEIRDDGAMRETVESVKQYGVICPAIVRPLENGDFEIIAGHRRRRACEIAGLDAMPSIVRELDDDAATIPMVDSNLQREFILPSERAKAYQMKMEAIRHQGERREVTSGQIVHKLQKNNNFEVGGENHCRLAILYWRE